MMQDVPRGWGDGLRERQVASDAGCTPGWGDGLRERQVASDAGCTPGVRGESQR